MADPDLSFRVFYQRAAFVAMIPAAANIPLLRATLKSLPLATQFAEVRPLPDGGAVVEWTTVTATTATDVALVNAAVAAFTGGATTSQPFSLESFGATPALNATPVLKASLATGPLDGGTYTFSWNSSLRMNPANVNGGVQGVIRLASSSGDFREQPDSWDLAFPHAFNGSIIFEVQAGQSLTATAHVLRLGSAGTAEMSGLRFTIDQLAPALS
jgi:hypothetical protein